MTFACVFFVSNEKINFLIYRFLCTQSLHQPMALRFMSMSLKIEWQKMLSGCRPEKINIFRSLELTFCKAP
jgi:hypothetical protein